MSRNDVTVDLGLANTSKLLDTSAMRIISPVAGEAVVDKSKTPKHKVSKAKKVIDYNSDSMESSQVQANLNSKQKAALARNENSFDSISESVNKTEPSDNCFPNLK